jgi:hypothetical protein
MPLSIKPFQKRLVRRLAFLIKLFLKVCGNRDGQKQLSFLLVFQEVTFEVVLTDIGFSRVAAVRVFKFGIRCKITGSPASTPTNGSFVTILTTACQHTGVEISIIGEIAFFMPDCG